MILYPPQLFGIQPSLLDRTGRFILNWEMGCGKSVGVCEIIKQRRYKRVLVVCPSIVKHTWGKAFDRFLENKPDVGMHLFGKERGGLSKKQQEHLEHALYAQFQIVSPDLISNISIRDWDLIVLDELHLYKNEKTVRAREARLLLELCADSYALGLTGTLAPNDLGDIWSPIDLLWPGRFGKKYAFQHRYQNKLLKVINDQSGETRTQFVGLREEHAAELAYRLSKLSTRVTREDLKEYLPAFDIMLLPLAVGFDWSRAGTTKEDIEAALAKAAAAKVAGVVDWVENAAETTTHICVLAHHHEVADLYAAALKKRMPLVPVIQADGRIPADKRMQVIEATKELPECILVCTIQSVDLGISLTKFTQAVCVEYHWSPGVMEQVLLRFSRLDSMLPSAVWFAYVAGTIDEVIATRLEEKLRSINPITKAGVVGSKLEGLLQVSDEEFLKDITKAAEQLETGGGYL